MKTKSIKTKSISVNFNSKPFNSKLKGEWDPEQYKYQAFMELYIKKKYSKDLHYLPFVDLYISYIQSSFAPPRIVFKFLNWVEGFSIRTKNVTKSFGKRFKYFENNIEKYKNTTKRFTYFPITRSVITKIDKNEDHDVYENHSMFAIYDKLNNEIEIFNSILEDNRMHDKNLKSFFTIIYGNKVNIIFPNINIFGCMKYDRCGDF